MKTDEIRGLADGDVKVRIAALEEERFRLRFRSGTEALEEPLRLRSIRRDIARLQTILRRCGCSGFVKRRHVHARFCASRAAQPNS